MNKLQGWNCPSHDFYILPASADGSAIMLAFPDRFGIEVLGTATLSTVWRPGFRGLIPMCLRWTLQARVNTSVLRYSCRNAAALPLGTHLRVTFLLTRSFTHRWAVSPVSRLVHTPRVSNTNGMSSPPASCSYCYPPCWRLGLPSHG